MRQQMFVRFSALALIALLALALAAQPGTALAQSGSGTTTPPGANSANKAPHAAALLAQAKTAGSVRIIVGVNAPFTPSASRQANIIQQSTIQQARQKVLSSLRAYKITPNRTDWVIPYMALTVDTNALQALIASPNVTSIVEDGQSKIDDTGSDALIGAPAAWNAGYTGQGEAVAILDNGVQENHPFLGNRVVGEACFSSGANGTLSLCPNGQPTQTGVGAAAPCDPNICAHGTHVAGDAAGNGLNLSGVGFGGVAINADIVAVNVFSGKSSDGTFGGLYGTTAWDSDIIAGMNWVYQNNASFNVAAVNLSLGDHTRASATYCDATSPATTEAIRLLRTVNVATIIASGNDSDATAISFPACISYAISVGAVDDSNNIASFSNSAPILSLLAPGVQVNSSVPNNSYALYDGTSMATPHVTGAWAALRTRLPGASVLEVLAYLQSRGVALTDGRNGVATYRIQLDQAAAGFTAIVPRHKTVGIYDPTQGKFFLKNTNTTGYADIYITYGPAPYGYPVVGDWTGAGIDTIGVYDQSNGLFHLRYSNSAGADDTLFTLGYPGDQPMSGRWYYSAPHDGVGVFRPSNGLIYLKNDLATGYADYQMVLGVPGDVGIAEDWNLDGTDSPGVYRPSQSIFYLSNQVTTGPVYADYQFAYGFPYDVPLVGDWSGSGQVGVGLYRAATGYMYLKNTAATGYADTYLVYGSPNWIPFAGHWTAGAKPPEKRITAPGRLIVPNAPLVQPTPKPTEPPRSTQASQGFDG